MDENALPDFLQGIVPAQIGILVPDLAAGIRTWSAILGRSDWRVYTYGPDWVPELTYRGFAKLAGFSNPGFLGDVLRGRRKLSEDEIKDWMMGNLCRCTGYYKIIESIQKAHQFVR